MSESPHVSVPIDILQKLMPLAEQMGVAEDLPGITRIAPTVDISMPIRVLALELGQMLSKQLLFVYGESVVTVEADTGEIRPMTPKRFVGWIEEYCAIKNNGRSQRTRDSLSREDADVILSQDIFRGCLRPLEAVHTMRLPVLRSLKPLKIDFLEPGYDEATHIYTVDRLKYPMDWKIEQSEEWLFKHAEAYPWSWPDDVPEVQRELRRNRSFAVHVFAMLSVYCKAMFPPGTLRPMVVYLANQVGTGKSTLAAMSLIPVFGHAASTGAPSNDENMEKTLDTVARTRQPYLFFDDIRYGINSNPLNRFLTSASHSGRCMGGNSEMFVTENVTQVLATGNALKVTEDLSRRSLIVELFCAGESLARQFDFQITVKYLAREEIRANFLAALCAILRQYVQEVEVTTASDPETDWTVHPRPVPTFEEFTGLIGQMVCCAGFGDPLAKPDIAPNEDEDEMRTLLVKAVTREEGARTFDRKEFVEIARECGLLEDLVGCKEGGEMDQKNMKRFGRQLQKWRGRELVDGRGRRFQFGHKRQKTGATYPFKFL